MKYPITDPATGIVYEPPNNGWSYRREVMAELIHQGSILFSGSRPRWKTPLKDMAMRSVVPSFYKDRRASSLHLVKVLGDKRFPFPKDHEVLMKWLRIAAPTDAVVLDFFGGSGSTTEAVMRLNADDGGTRRSVLITNNEVAAADAKALAKSGRRPGDPEWEAKGVCKYVAEPRIKTVVTGIRPDGSKYSDGLEANVEFFDLTYEAPLRVASNYEFARVAPLLWLRAGSRGRRIDDISTGWDVADTYGVIANFDESDKFLAAMSDKPDTKMAFIVTDDNWLFESMCRDLPEHVEPVRLYEAYLRNFEIESGRGIR